MKRMWTEEEEKFLVDWITDHGTGLRSFSEAGERLNRSGNACRMYYQSRVQEGRWKPHGGEGRGHPWSAARTAELLERLRRGETPSQIAQAMGLSLPKISSQLQRLRVTGEAPPSITPEWTPPSEDDPAHVWSRAEQQTTRDVEKHAKRRFASVNFTETQPIGIAFVSDQHIRLSGPVALKQMREDAALIRETPRLYAVLGGDAVDNHIVISQAMARGGSKPSEEWRLFEHYLQMFGDPGASKILAVISGNHDDWTIDKAGVDVLGMLVKAQRLHYSPFEVVLRASVGSQCYSLKCRHRYSKFGSSFNPSHKVKRMWEMGEDDFDVGVICHDHEPSMEQFWKQGRLRVAFRPGSYQFTSSYAETHGFPRYAPTCPTVVLYPDSRLVLPFISVHQAAEYLRLTGEQVA